LAGEIQAKNGGNSTTGNAFQGDIGFDYMGFSLDFVASKVTDALSIGATLSAAQVALISPAQCSVGCLGGVVSDNTAFAVAAKYTIGAWKFFGGYEHIQYQNPNNPMMPYAFAMGGYNVAFVNNAFYQTDRIMNIFWVGARYAVTPTLDVTGAYYGYRQNNFLQSLTPAGSLSNPSFPAGAIGAVNPGNVGCSSSAFAGCSGAMNMYSVALDWRFARHFDFYAGVAYSEKSGGLANGYVTTATNPSVAATFNTFNKVSNYDPSIGLRYQF